MLFLLSSCIQTFSLFLFGRPVAPISEKWFLFWCRDIMYLYVWPPWYFEDISLWWSTLYVDCPYAIHALHFRQPKAERRRVYSHCKCSATWEFNSENTSSTWTVNTLEQHTNRHLAMPQHQPLSRHFMKHWFAIEVCGHWCFTKSSWPYPSRHNTGHSYVSLYFAKLLL